MSLPSHKIAYDIFVLDGEAAFVTRLEGLNFDSTVAALGRYSQYDNVAISVKRVYQRGEVIVQMVGPGGMKIKTFLPESSIMTEQYNFSEAQKMASENFTFGHSDA